MGGHSPPGLIWLLPGQKGSRAMSSKYAVVSGAVFAVVAALHALRALNQWPLSVGGLDIPVWGSWVATAVAGSLCVWAFRSGRK